MPTIHNPTGDDLAFPGADGVEVPIPAGQSVDVDSETAKQLKDHPLLKVGRAAAAKKATRARKRTQKNKPDEPASSSAGDGPAENEES